MSKCNHKRKRLDCNSSSDEAFFQSIDECLAGSFNPRGFFHLLDHFNVKCFNFSNQFTNYVDYMSQILQPKRFESEQSLKRETNKPRKKDKECIWKSQKLQEKAEEYLLKFDYYKFCSQCMGTENEIPGKN
ncbi:hypothetical protein ACHAWF_018044 [Thalassiosira exigua]